MQMSTADALHYLRQVAEQYPGTYADHLKLQEALKVLAERTKEEMRKDEQSE